ncbi:MAG TPA: PepSY domain-containing protein [Prolixibacteraceae bacterium]|nr:PepSY domain-containing protein [Prolixibacteraceae bacterium]
MSPELAKWVRKFKKYHKWPGIVITLFILLFAVSGIILNHRNIISSVDISRNLMPPGYQYKNWNLSGVRSSVVIGNDSLLLYGNIGVWLTTNDLSDFQDFNNGFPDGIDRRKIYAIVKFRNLLVAGTHSGLFYNSLHSNKWVQYPMMAGQERISDLAVKGDTLLILTRDFLFRTTDMVHLKQADLPPPIGYERKISLFLTLWELHSGELFGFAGKLFVDLLGFVLIFLSLTGLLHFLFPKWISRLKQNRKSYAGPLAMKKLNIKWHNLIGYIFAAFLVINTTAGMFLRPPLLIPIASTVTGILPYTHLDTDNPWHDKLRRITWNEAMNRYLLYTSDGFFMADDKLSGNLVPVPDQPPVSIMGCNVLEPLDQYNYLVGSFSGLFSWNPATGVVLDYFTGVPAGTPRGIGRPVGQNMVAGFIRDGNGRNFWFDYNQGAIAADGGIPFPAMPEVILKHTPISLWNAALEVHTGRIFEHLVGPFYLLYVPLTGLILLIVLISGFLIWWFGYRRRG